MTTGIFKSETNNDYFWVDDLEYYPDKENVKNAKYFVDEDVNDSGCHANIKSALYDDMMGYVDELQDEQNLSYGELYVVIYFEFEECSHSLLQKVDFGITKEQIIENVKANKYVEGTNYFTMGQMFYTT